jgi:hypothetical protein
MSVGCVVAMVAAGCGGNAMPVAHLSGAQIADVELGYVAGHYSAVQPLQWLFRLGSQQTAQPYFAILVTGPGNTLPVGRFDASNTYGSEGNIFAFDSGSTRSGQQDTWQFGTAGDGFPPASFGTFALNITSTGPLGESSAGFFWANPHGTFTGTFQPNEYNGAAGAGNVYIAVTF